MKQKWGYFMIMLTPLLYGNNLIVYITCRKYYYINKIRLLSHKISANLHHI